MSHEGIRRTSVMLHPVVCLLAHPNSSLAELDQVLRVCLCVVVCDVHLPHARTVSSRVVVIRLWGIDLIGSAVKHLIC